MRLRDVSIKQAQSIETNLQKNWTTFSSTAFINQLVLQIIVEPQIESQKDKC